MDTLTKLARDVFAAFTSGGQARKIDPQDAALWGTEIERAFEALDTDVEERISEAEALLQAGVKPPLLAVRLLVTTDVNLSTAAEAGDTLDGLVLVAGERIAKAYMVDEDTGHPTNGIYVVQSSGAAVRATDADTGDELEYATFYVDEGTRAGEQWAVKTGSIPMLGTTPIAIKMVRAAAGYEAEVIAARGTQPALNDRMDGLQAIASVGLASSDGSVRDYRRNAGVSRDLTTALNNIAGAAADTVTFARNLAAYRIDAAGSVASVLANVLRIHHDKDGNPLGALIEFSQTNRLLRNRDFTNAAWTKFNVTVTAAAITIRGLSFSKIEATTTGNANLQQIVSSAGHASGNTAIWTVAKGSGANVANYFLLRNSTTATNLRFFRVNYDTGEVTDTIGSGGVTVTDMGGYWRIVLKWTTGISAGNSLAVYGCFSNAPTAGDYAYLANVQLHDRMVDTSDIDTTTVAVTRPADVITKAVADMPFVAGRGTMNVEWGPGQILTTTVLVELDDGTVNNRILIGLNANGTVFGQIVSGGITQALITTGASYVSGGSAYLAWKANDVELVVDGVSIGTDTAASIPTVTTYRVGSNYGAGQQPNGTIKRDAYYPRRLATSEMVQDVDDEEEPPTVIDVDDDGDILTSLAQSSAARSVFRTNGGVVYEKTVSTKQQIAIIDHDSDAVISDGTANDRFPTIIGNAVRFASDRQGAVLREYRMLADGKSLVAAGASNKVYLILGYGDSTSIGSAFTGETPNQFTTAADFLGAVLGFNGGPRHAGSSQNSGAGGLTAAVPAGDIDRLIPLVAVRDSSAYGETHLEVAAYRLRDECDLRVITANPGVGGAVATNLVKGTVPYANCLSYAERAQEIIGSLGWDLEVVVTLNNGTNQSTTDKATYKAFMAQVYADFATDLAAITGQTSFHLFAAQPGVLNNSQVPIAIWEASKENPNIHCVGPTYEIEYIDTAHPAYLGYTEMSDIYFRAMKTVLADEAEWKPLQPISAVRAAAVIDVLCEGQTGAVQILAVPGHSSVATNHGIEFWDDSGVPPAVNSVVAITGGFRVTLASTPSGSGQVLRGAWTRYGTIPTADAIARTDIADSDTMVATHDGHAMQKRLVNFEIAVTT